MAASRTPNRRLVPAPAENLCVAFANTRYRRGREPAAETLNRLGDVLAWCERTKSIDGGARAELDAWASRHPADATRLFDEAIAARELLYGLFDAQVERRAAAERDLEALNRLLGEAPSRASLAPAPDGTAWHLPSATPTTASLLAPVLWSAGDLLGGRQLDRLRMCANQKCRWLFIDDSKSGTRRWCSMNSCGNRAKAHRHYLKKTGAAAEPAA